MCDMISSYNSRQYKSILNWCPPQFTVISERWQFEVCFKYSCGELLSLWSSDEPLAGKVEEEGVVVVELIQNHTRLLGDEALSGGGREGGREEGEECKEEVLEGTKERRSIGGDGAREGGSEGGREGGRKGGGGIGGDKERKGVVLKKTEG